MVTQCTSLNCSMTVDILVELICHVMEMSYRRKWRRFIKIVLKNQQDLQPMKTDHFVVYPCKKQWNAARQLKFLENGKKLEVSPNMFLIYLEDNDDRLVQGTSNDNITDEVTRDSKRKKPVALEKSSRKHSSSVSHEEHKANVIQAEIKTPDGGKQSSSGKYFLRKRPVQQSNEEPSSKRPVRRLIDLSQDVKTRSSSHSPYEGTTAEADGIPEDPEVLS
uniref:Uncharacterized protein LOC102805210 isoform X2 n=1 Tax=Saccoglossus kowalevskii TaxID=10224 RepID=A0ABM0LWQ2_SACKO|nr:PREDICTED: uncharacterized protein LOC102805210 isoform X2 [Saccoglossus kowalevskii]